MRLIWDISVDPSAPTNASDIGIALEIELKPHATKTSLKQSLALFEAMVPIATGRLKKLIEEMPHEKIA